MSNNMLDVGLGQAERVTRKALENDALVQRFSALVSRACWMAYKSGKSFKGITIGQPTMGGRRITAQMLFPSFEMAHTPNWTGRVDGVGAFVAKRAAWLGGAVRENPTFFNWLETVVGLIERYASAQGKSFTDVAFESALIDENNVIVLELKP